MATPAEVPSPTTPADHLDPPAAEVTELGPLQTDRGATTIADQVVHKIVDVVVGEVSGVYPADGPGSITVQKGERQTAVDLSVVVDYGVSIVDVSRTLRRTVIEAVERGTGLEVTEVNIQVTDVRLPGGSHPLPPPATRLA